MTAKAPATAAAPEMRVTVQKAAELTGLSVDTIRSAIKSRHITATYPTSRPMVSTAELREWFDAAPDRPGGKT